MIIHFEKIIEALREIDEKIAYEKIEPHLWFAWYPVRVGKYTWAWLSVVKREYTLCRRRQDNSAFNFTKRYNKPIYHILPE